MMISRSRLVLATTISLIASCLGSSVLAEPNSTATDNNHSNDAAVITYENVQDLFQKAITYESGNFLTNRSIGEQLQLIFGFTDERTQGISAFPENEIMRDTVLLHKVYEDFLKQQAGDDPIRTRDLENPYNTSLGSPDYSAAE